jgi:hypothetical protein
MANAYDCESRNELSINARPDGTLEAAYVQVSEKAVASTRELIRSVLVVDFDADGELVGVEFLAPVKVADVEKIAKSLESPQRDSFETFIHKYIPSALMSS